MARAIAYAAERLAAAQLGLRLNQLMDSEWGAERANQLQRDLIAPWLESVAKELRA